MRRRLVFIINPKAGTDRVKSLRAAIDETLDRNAYDYEIAYTQYAHHGTELAREAAAAGAYGVIAVGGDGSVNDVATGLLDTDAVLGIVPMGSGNGLARSLKIPLDARKAIALLNGNKTTRIDAGFANGKLFLSNAGVGFDALVSTRFRTMERRGLRDYVKLVCGLAFSYKPRRYTLTVDGAAMEREAFLINLANAPVLGYQFSIAPQADPRDGLLDVTILKPFPWTALAGLCWRLWHGSLSLSSYSETMRAQGVRISSSAQVEFQCDGDGHAGEAQVEMSMRKSAINVFI